MRQATVEDKHPHVVGNACQCLLELCRGTLNDPPFQETTPTVAVVPAYAPDEIRIMTLTGARAFQVLCGPHIADINLMPSEHNGVLGAAMIGEAIHTVMSEKARCQRHRLTHEDEDADDNMVRTCLAG